MGRDPNHGQIVQIYLISICQRGEYHSMRALIGSSDAGYPVLVLAKQVDRTFRAF